MEDRDREGVENWQALYRRWSRAASQPHPRRWPTESQAAQTRSIVLFVALCSAAFLFNAPLSYPGASRPAEEQGVETPSLDAREGEGRAHELEESAT